MNDAEIMELVDEVRRCERAVQQAKNALEVAKRDAAVAAEPLASSFHLGSPYFWDSAGRALDAADRPR